MKKALASLLASAFLMTGVALAAPSAKSTAKPHTAMSSKSMKSMKSAKSTKSMKSMKAAPKPKKTSKPIKR